MHNGPDFDKLIEPIIEIYQKLELELIGHIASHFKLYEPIGFKNSMEWYIKKIEELGGLNQEAVRIISEQTQIPKSKIIKMLKDVGISTIDLDTVDKLNATRNYKINVDKLKTSQSFLNIVNNSYKEIDGIFKMIHTNALQGMQESYMNVLNQAYTEVQSGMTDYNSAIRKALTQMAKQGITAASYKQKSGKVIHYDIESCVRRDVLTAVVQCTNNASTQFAKDMKAEYYEVSQHLGARVTNTHDYKDHSWWQGKVYKIDGSTKEYPNYQETCKEGDVQGIAGANCRHIKWPFWPGISVPKKVEISPEENEKKYRLNQQQNTYERNIRDCRRQIEVAKASNDYDKYQTYKEKLQEVDKEYNQFCKDNNLKRRFSREYVVETNKNVNFKLSKETKDKLKILGLKGDDSLVKIDKDLLEVNIEQLKKLTEKYQMKDFFETYEVDYGSLNKSSVASVGIDKDLENIYLNSSTNSFKNKEAMQETMNRSIKINWCMPFKKENMEVYAMTHEFGHLLEIKIFKSKYLFGDRDMYYNYSNKIKDAIINIVHEKNENFNIEDALSGYSHRNSREFFAEAFANMELGKPNEIGKALEEYLKGVNL